MSILVHDLIKIKYSNLGYLPDYPYHLISDEEMCDAFLPKDRTKTNFFFDNYALPFDQFKEQHDMLVMSIEEHLDELRNSGSSDYVMPDWVYSYMLGKVISSESPVLDRHDLLVLLNIDNINDQLTPEFYTSCYEISSKCVSSPSSVKRAPSIFGEPAVIKFLRVQNVEVR